MNDDFDSIIEQLKPWADMADIRAQYERHVRAVGYYSKQASKQATTGQWGTKDIPEVLQLLIGALTEAVNTGHQYITQLKEQR